jgi:hypothetical protein
MANLIEQMNILKGLTDEHLATEVHAPSGSAPPFLVLSELNRRKGMRERYEQEAARHAPRTTVVDDMMTGLPAGGGDPSAAPPMGGGGIGPMPEQAAPPAGFADGGIVDYADIASKYQDRLTGLDDDKDRARALALLAAGAGIMGGGHSNTLQNLGLGINAGVSSYSDALKTIDTDELNLLRGITDIGQAQSAEELAKQDRDFRERQLAQDQSQFDARTTADNTPAAVRESLWYSDPATTDEQRAAYDKLHPSYNPNALNNDQLIGAKTDAIYQDALKAYPSTAYASPEEMAANQQRAQIAAYNRIAAAYGEVQARNWAAGMGINIPTGDLVTGGAPGTGAPANGAVSYTDYFN